MKRFKKIAVGIAFIVGAAGMLACGNPVDSDLPVNPHPPIGTQQGNQEKADGAIKTVCPFCYPDGTAPGK